VLVTDTFIQKTKKLYLDTKSERNLDRVAKELTEVHQVMTRNIQEILSRGQKIDSSSPLLPPCHQHLLEL
jgi:vesicle transport protein SEC22